MIHKIKNSALTLIILVAGVSCCNLNEKQKININAINTNSSCLQDCCSSIHQVRRPAQTYIYYQNTGKFKGGSDLYAINVLGYSGQGAGYNNPDYQCKQGGPLPSSIYQVAFCKNMMHQVTQRPCSFYLKPKRPLQVCDRDDFFIHGCTCCTSGDDTNPPSPGCSAGCIVISYAQRKKIRIGDTIIVQSYEPKFIQQIQQNQIVDEK